jgi:23S rRNA-/tRNA-specific pseudouridylate synthase
MARLAPAELERRILREDGDVIVVDKPSDLPTSGRSLDDDDCLQRALIVRGGGMVWAVHQLDADTSGVNLFTTQRELVEPLKRALGAPGARKLYLAIAHGSPTWDARECLEPIGAIDERSLGVTPDGRPARSRLRVLARSKGHVLFAVEIETGRTHQIRIHASHLGHPLVGEEWYRDPPCSLHPRQALHARSMRIGGPIPLDVKAPVPDDLGALMGTVGLDPPDELETCNRS